MAIYAQRCFERMRLAFAGTPFEQQGKSDRSKCRTEISYCWRSAHSRTAKKFEIDQVNTIMFDLFMETHGWELAVDLHREKIMIPVIAKSLVVCIFVLAQRRLV